MCRKIKCKQDSTGGSCLACASSGRQCYFLPRIKAGRPRRNRSPKRNHSISSTVTSPVDPPTPSLHSSWQNSSTTGYQDSFAEADWATSPLVVEDNDIFSNAAEDDYFTGTNPYQVSATNTPFGTLDLSETLRPKPSERKLSMPEQGLPFDYLPSPGLTMTLSPSDVSPHSHACCNGAQRRSAYLSETHGTYDRSQSTSCSSTTPKAPTFMELLRKCSELEIQLEALRNPDFLLYNADTALPSNKLIFIEDSIGVAGSMIQHIASMTQESLGFFSSQTGLDQGLFEGSLDNISPSALTRDAASSTGSYGEQVQPASLALCVALALKVTEICDILALVEPSNRQSRHHMIFLKRLDLSVAHIQSSISMIQGHKEATKGSLANDTMNRAVMVQRRIQQAMKESCFGSNSF